MGGPGEQLRRGRLLDDVARVHDRDPIRELDEQRQVVGDEEHGEAHLPLQLLELLQDLALNDHVERCRRLVEQEQLGAERHRHRDHHALSHSAGELVGICAEPAPVDAHDFEQLGRLHEREALRDLLVREEHVDELVLDAGDGVERAHRALEDDRDVAPANLPELAFRQADEVPVAEQDLSSRNAPRGPEHLQDRVRDRALPAARLACEPDDLPGPDDEGDPVHRRHGAALRAVLDDEVSELEERRSADGPGSEALRLDDDAHRALLGLSTRRRTPRRLSFRRRRGSASSSMP